jgi:hypothetical protein
MTPSELLYIIKILAIPMWILMVILPERKLTRQLIESMLIPKVMFVLFTIFLILKLQHGGGFSFANFGAAISLVTFQNFFLAFMVFMKAGDLMLGMSILNNSRDDKVSHILVIPCLVTAYYVGPIGYLLYKIVRRVSKIEWISKLSRSSY